MLQRSKKLIVELGWFNAFVYMVDRALRKLNERCRLHSYYLVAQPVPEQPRPARPGSRLEVHQVHTPEELGRGFGRPAQVIKRRFDDGAVCLAASLGDEPVGFLWLQLGDYEEDEVRCRFVPQPVGKAAWDFDVYVEPKHRLGRAFVRLWDEANAFLRERGFEWVMGRIEATALASLASHRRMGTTVVGRALFLSIGRFQVTFSTLRPNLHFSARLETPPRLLVPAPVRAD